MSLITLTSTINSGDPRPTDPAIIKCNFTDGITIKKGSEVGLVNMTINKEALFDVPPDTQLVFRIGDRTNFQQHTASIPAGNYTGSGLATEVALACNNATLIGVYKGGWTCVYDPTAQDNEGGFTLTYNAQSTPAESGQTFTSYAGNLSITNGTPVNASTIVGTLQGGTDDTQIPPNIATAPKGIFGNGGTIDCVVAPYLIASKSDWDTTFTSPTGPGAWQEVDGGVPLNTFDISLATGAPLALGWQYLLTSTTGQPDEYWAFKDNVASQSFWTGDGTSAPGTGDPIFWSPLALGIGDGALQDVANGGRGASTGGGKYYAPTAGFWIGPNETLGYYGVNQVGYVRNNLYNGKTTYPGDANAEINGDINNGGFDIQFQLKSTGALSDTLAVSLGQLTGVGGTPFPNPNWRGNSGLIFNNLNPLTDFTTRTGATNWTTFTTGDHIKLEVKIEGIRKIVCKISHDSAGNGVFSEHQTLATTSVQGFVSRIKESHYPLRPVIAKSNGGFYNDEFSQAIVNGIFDTAEHTSSLAITAQDGDGDDTADDRLDLSALTLSALFKMGLITADEIGNGPEQIPQADFDGAQGNVAHLLGVRRFYVFPSGQLTNPVVSDSDPFVSVAEPTLLLELFDFNIKGYNGRTGDTSKVIAVIPKEELQTGDRQGVLHYYPQFPVFIDLNIPEDKTYYDLNALIRTPDGRIATDLINPTEITLLVRESEETKQRRLNNEMAQSIATAIANRNDTKINQIGVNNPRI